MHLLMEQIHTAWKSEGGSVASLLLLDVSGAFDNVNYQRLLWNIRELGFHPNLAGWMASFLAGRTGRIKLTEGITPSFNISTGIPQGSPLSPILWLLYNYKILRVAEDKALVTGYVDDTCVLVTGRNTTETCQKLGEVHKQLEGWASRHAAKFAPEKYGLMHFFQQPRKTKDEDKNRPLILQLEDGQIQEIKPSESERYLGVWLDPCLRGQSHLEQAPMKARQHKEALRSIAQQAWGVSSRA